MKRFLSVVCICACVLSLTACGKKEEAPQLGVNAVITAIDRENKMITVKDSDAYGVLGGVCNIDCAEVPVVYCDYATGELTTLSFEDLQVDDEILLQIKGEIPQNSSTEENAVRKITAEQIQLATQRLA